MMAAAPFDVIWDAEEKTRVVSMTVDDYSLPLRLCHTHTCPTVLVSLRGLSLK